MNEVCNSNEPLDSVQTHFYASNPLELQTDFQVDTIDKFGTFK